MKTKMKTKKIILVGTMLLNAGHAFASGNGAGNGGNVGVCFNSSKIVEAIKENNNQISDDQIANIISVNALDLYEARSRYDSPTPDSFLVLPAPMESEQAYINRIAERFRESIPALSEILETSSGHLAASDKRYYNSGGIDRVYDSGDTHYLDPKKCVIATAIRQSNGNGIEKLEIDNRLFKHVKHSDASRKVLMLHEVVLHWAIGNSGAKKITDTTSLRTFVGTLIQKTLTFGEVAKPLQHSEYQFMMDSHFDSQKECEISWSKYVNIFYPNPGACGFALIRWENGEVNAAPVSRSSDGAIIL